MFLPIFGGNAHIKGGEYIKMTLEEAIIHCEEVADRCDVTDGNIKCANEHRQLAGWLRDYKRLLKERESCEDAVSREDVLDVIARIGLLKNETKEIQSISECLKEVEKLPSVNPQPKTGYWIDADGDNATCGCCNRLNHLYGTYCKHCGAKMVESRESEVSDADSN